MNKNQAENHINAIRDSYKNNYSTSKINTYEYWARVLKFIDGDTLDVAISLGFDLTVEKRLRLIGVNTPEIFGVKRNTDTYKRGIRSLEFVKNFVPDHGWVEAKVFSGRREKYGRWLAEVYVKNQSLNVELLTLDLALPT